MRHTSSIIENKPHRVFHDGASDISIYFNEDVNPELVDQAFAEWYARTRAGERDFHVDINGICALLNIPIMLIQIDEDDFNSPCAIKQHEHKHKNSKVEKIIEYLRELILSPEPQNFLDKRLCMDLLQGTCDTFNYNAHETPRDIDEWLQERAARATYANDNAAQITCSMLSKKLKEESDPCDTKPWSNLLEALVVACESSGFTNTPAYLEAHAALYGY